MRGIICTRQDNKINKFLLCFVSLLISTQAFTLEIEAPAILLTNVPAEFSVSGALPGEQIRLSIAGMSRVASADDDGTAVFSEIVAKQRGGITLSASSIDSGSATANLRVLPGWVSILPPLLLVRPDKSGRLFPSLIH